MKVNYRAPAAPARPGQGLRPPGNLGTLPPPPVGPAWAALGTQPVPFAWWLWVLGTFAVLGGAVLWLEDADKAAAQARYCARVHAGDWPDYKKAYRELCRSNGTPRPVMGPGVR